MNKIDLSEFNEGDILMLPTSYRILIGVIMEGQLRQIKTNGVLGKRIIRKAHGATKLNVKFTEFLRGKNWCKGSVGKYHFSCKLFDVGSSYGINDGRVSTLSIMLDGNYIMNYDRGWDLMPTKEHNPIYATIMYFLGIAPKRWGDNDEPLNIEEIKPNVDDEVTPMNFLAMNLYQHSSEGISPRWLCTSEGLRQKFLDEANEIMEKWGEVQRDTSNEELSVIHMIAALTYTNETKDALHWTLADKPTRFEFVNKAEGMYNDWRNSELNAAEARGF